MNRRGFLQGSVAGAGIGMAGLALPGVGSAAAEPDGSGHAGRLRLRRTTVEYADTLLGTDVENPRLSWVHAAGGHGAAQSAYRIQVATDPRALDRGRDLEWDSGKVTSERSVGIEYQGPRLRPRTRYHWRVRVWDERGRPSRWSERSWWETGMRDQPWQASWIGDAVPEPPLGLEGASWIWSAGATQQDAPAGPRWFRGVLDLPSSADVSSARVVATADDDFTLYLGGGQVLHAPQQVDGWKTAHAADVTEQVGAAGGRVVLAALATNRGGASVNPGGLLVRLVVDTGSGVHELVSDAGWLVADTEQDGWAEPSFDDSGWAPANVLAPHGEGPWGDQVGVTVPERPAPLLRREFDLDKPIERARLYICGLAYYEAEINGDRIGEQVLDPGFTDYGRTALYAVHDVTRVLAPGANALGVTLGRGFYAMTTPNVWRWNEPDWRSEPALLAQLEVEHPDGSRTTIGSDESWRISSGPSTTNSLYEGETYDARRAMNGWSSPGFDASAWQVPQQREAPAGVLKAQQHEPIEVIETVRPSTINDLGNGSYVVDMGRTMAGWTRLTVRAPEGTAVELKHGEKLGADGSVQVDIGNVHSARLQTDVYICAGTGSETWEPKFSYKGFRYVQVNGLPAKPAPEAVVGRLVHSAVPETGEFACSEPFYEQLDAAMRKTLRNNLHGIPTDTPMYEKNGWTGDAQVGLPTMMYAFGLSRFLTKWAGDLADSEHDEGQVPVIVPSGGWGYRELAPAPEWTTVYPFLLREMYRVYGDERLAARHWDTLIGYLDWEIGRLENNLAITALGDYLPPGYGGNPPEDTRLTATAYLYRALTDAAELGDLLGHPDVAGRYRAVAADCRTALNDTFLGPDGYYRTAKDPGYRQTSNAVPLAFGIVPPAAEASVLASLVADIETRGNHLNTGALGTSVLLPVLCAHGYAGLAHAIATQRSYPSWGYWFDNGADTMWEMWEADSRSRDHYFKGTIAQWLYHNVAGLRPVDAGYRELVVRPDARAGVHWARTSIETVRGTASAGWAEVGNGLHLTVEVPVGASAEVHVPAADRADVHSAPVAEFVRTEPGFVVLRAGQGHWRFTTKRGGGQG